jgi:hypothetical protein
MRVSYSVMAHVDRADEASALAESLGGCDIAWDSALLAYGETLNGDRAWALHDPSCAWHVVLQDDALPVDGFLEAVPQALAHAGGTLVSLYVGGGRPYPLQVGAAVANAKRAGRSWLESAQLLWGVAVAMPTPLVPEFQRWGFRQEGVYDKRLGRFAVTKGMRVRYTTPSLVDHADGPTLITHPWGPPTTPRRARSLGIADTYDTPTVVIK